ncbi:Testin [Liparis tanakae]|uniref:Testin n=1 Tax=Liparis tanakae TaxID=230148 RepID=A0A4Z2E0J1_9TELE|nr:Testin [Liparis tanakae]
MTLGHEFGAGASCLKCEERCDGFELHFWRYVRGREEWREGRKEEREERDDTF